MTNLIENLNDIFDKDTKINKLGKPFIIDFYGEWCSPCKMLSSIIDSIIQEINIVKINVDEYPELASQYSVKSLPVLVFVDTAGNMETTVGLISKEKIVEKYSLLK